MFSRELSKKNCLTTEEKIFVAASTARDRRQIRKRSDSTEISNRLGDTGPCGTYGESSWLLRVSYVCDDLQGQRSRSGMSGPAPATLEERID